MARRLDFVEVVLHINREKPDNLVRSVGISYGGHDPTPASGKEFDRQPFTASGIPGFTLSNALRDAMIDDVATAVRTEASIPSLRTLTFLKITLRAQNNGGIVRTVRIQFGAHITNPASGRAFDKRITTLDAVPGYSMPNSLRDSVLDPVIAAARTEMGI